jgi:hypothetical protein
MAFKLIQAAQDRWRAVKGPHLVALVRAGATFINGKLVERPNETHRHHNRKSLKNSSSTGLGSCSHEPAGVGVEHDRAVDPALVGAVLGDVGNP